MSVIENTIDKIGGFSAVKKMPCYSWGLSAWSCITGSKLADNAENSPCARCYARKGFYHMPNVKDSVERRMEILTKALSNHRDSVSFVSAFSLLLNYRLETTLDHIETYGIPPRRDGRYFRWFDSGDLQSVNHLTLIGRIASATPGVEHWIPTQEAEFVDSFMKSFEGSMIPRNMLIRISSSKLDTPQKRGKPHKNITYSFVDTKGSATCPASSQGHMCLDCRRCWDSKVEFISYDEI